MQFKRSFVLLGNCERQLKIVSLGIWVQFIEIKCIGKEAVHQSAESQSVAPRARKIRNIDVLNKYTACTIK